MNKVLKYNFLLFLKQVNLIRSLGGGGGGGGGKKNPTLLTADIIHSG